MDQELNQLIAEANKKFRSNFPNTTWFERAVFYSWSCSIKDCKFCYMSTTKDDPNKEAVRSEESILAEAIIIRELGWKLGFFSGGIGILPEEKLLSIIRNINIILNEKTWVNVGLISRELTGKLNPYIEGIVGSVETVNKKLHNELCPSKPLKPIEDMFQRNIKTVNSKNKIKNGMTLIVGLGETKKDFELLKSFIEKNRIEKIHIYGLNPHPGTIFENKPSPTKEYQAWWIAKTRIAFPKIDIQCGIWEDKTENLSLLLKAGANSISKYPAIRQFNSKTAKAIGNEAKIAGRKFLGSLTKLPEIDWDGKVEELGIDADLKKKIKSKLNSYLKSMQKHF